jgi:siderophore synthetase component
MSVKSLGNSARKLGQENKNSVAAIHDGLHQVHQILQPELWEKASRKLLAKIISELMYEEMLQPDLIERSGKIGLYRLTTMEGIVYQFSARIRLFDSFRVNEETIVRIDGNISKPATNPIQLLMDIQKTVGMSSTTLGHLIKEYNHTLVADTHILAKKTMSEEDVTDLDYYYLEGEMEGHPWITYNKGRIGFGYDDYLCFAPEQKQGVRLFWLGVSKQHATFHSINSYKYENLLENELSTVESRRFYEAIANEGLHKEDYWFLPVHEWQWKNVIIPFFPEDISNRAIIPLGWAEDEYLPQQSVRTFSNISNKLKHHVKLPMSILNTLVYRGLPAERTVIAPRITDYIKGIYEKDTFLKDECRMILPGEVASINYEHPYYSKLPGAPYQYLEMLGCIWRESIYSYMDEGEKPITLAALTYVDGVGKPYISVLIEKSGLSVDEWINKLFGVMMPPLLHYLYQYGVVFSPHGQNTILTLKNHIPERLVIKDFVDDVNVSQHPLPELASLEQELKGVLRSEPPEGLCQFIFTGLFICVLRYVSDILEEHHQYEEERFWSQLKGAIIEYQGRFPELKERYQLFDLMRPSFTKLCLNRNRMLDYGYEDDGERPHASEYGKVKNALHDL